jgi:putative restriction endonuclease
MIIPLQHYRNEFRSLSGRDRSGDYEGVALGGAPHQPVVLLMILDLYAHDPRRHNLIEPDGFLKELWTIYKELLGIAVGSPLEMPLYALRRTSFWHLVARPNTSEPTQRIRNRRGFYVHYVGIVLDDSLHSLLQEQSSRTTLREDLIRSYFPTERWLALQDGLIAASDDILADNAYAQRLLVDASFGSQPRRPMGAEEDRVLRDASFRKVVTYAYNYRCAFCGVRLQASNGHIMVEAAHIVPWAESHDDRPVNGLSLCPLCHWAFDKHLLALDLNLQILTHARIQQDDNVPAHLAALGGRSIFRPREERFLPDTECLEKHLCRFRSLNLNSTEVL